MDETTARLSEYARAVDGDALPQGVRLEVGRRLVDSVACALGGLDAEPVVALRNLATERRVPKGVTLWGSPARTSPELAALANATAVRFLDYSDYASGGHPSDMIAAVVAACEWSDADVDDLVAGIVIAYEVQGEIGRLYLRERGWDQGTTAVIATTCAVGRVLGLAEEQLAHAIGMATVSNVSMVKARRGDIAMWKGVAVPYAAQCALLTAAMAARGITGPLDAFAGEFGFWEQVSGGPFDLEHLDPAEPRHVLQAGYKFWPVEYEAQAAIWMAQDIRLKLSIDDIDSVEVVTSEWTRGAIANDPAKWHPTTRETADHSLPYIFAVALVRGRVDVADFSDEAIASEVYADLMARMTVSSADDISASAHEFVTMRALVRTRQGDDLPFEYSMRRGRSMSDSELDDKWRLLAGASRLADRVEPLRTDLLALHGDQPVREMMAPLAVS